jgi:glutamyl-tRNA reductase
LADACQRNRSERAKELPAAEAIVDDEAARFVGEVHHRASAPVIARFRQGLEHAQSAELERLFGRLPELDERSQREIRQFADRLVGKMLHPPLESLRDESRNGPPHGLLEALQRLFQLKD